ncbi:MAG: hypothetical protein J3K34DRAFT_476899 [Monoraphidium minutum]|nr:MAG: hypothetical protein J3K34DRAFT_476899 [Monoraphidium minutum]
MARHSRAVGALGPLMAAAALLLVAGACALPRAAAQPCPWCGRLGRTTPQQLRVYLAPLPERWAVRAAGNSHYQGVSQDHPFGAPVPAPLAAAAAPPPRARRTYPTASGQLWDTYMFSTGQWWLKQMRGSPLRVRSAAAADVVFVPLDTLSLMAWAAGGPTNVSEWYMAAPALLPLLGRKPHVVVLSKGEYDYVNTAHCSGAGGGSPDSGAASSAASAAAAAATFSVAAAAGGSSESDAVAGAGAGADAALAAPCYGLVGHPGAADFTFLVHGHAPKLRPGHKSYIAGNVINIPFPAWVHFSRGSPEYASPPATPAAAGGGGGDAAQAAPPRLGPAFDASEVAASKGLLVSMAFATRKPFRHLLRAQCAARRGRCGFMEVETAQVARDKAGQPQDADQHMAELASIAQLTRDAWFCAMPPGDQPLRKAQFDCMLLGAIPVLFEPYALDTFTFSDMVDPRQFVIDLSPAIAAGRLAMPGANTTAPGAAANATAAADGAGPGAPAGAFANFVDFLETEYPLERRLGMLSKLHAWQAAYQYSLDPVHEVVSFDAIGAAEAGDDAFTLSWKAALRALCGAGKLPAPRCAGGGGGDLEGGGGGAAGAGGGALPALSRRHMAARRKGDH